MTQPVTFEPHARYVLHGSGYQVLQLLDDGTLVVRNLTTNALMTHRLTELWQAWQDNTLEFVGLMRSKKIKERRQNASSLVGLRSKPKDRSIQKEETYAVYRIRRRLSKGKSPATSRVN
jgi:hypothetical protein